MYHNPTNTPPLTKQNFSLLTLKESLDVEHLTRITLKEPFGPFINSLAHASAAIISPTALKKYGKDIAFHPVGTGPFTFVDWKQTDYVKGAKFADYWQAGFPKVDTITWKPVPENGTRAAMLRRRMLAAQLPPAGAAEPAAV